MMQFFHPITEIFGIFVSPPLATIVFGIVLILVASFIRHLDMRVSRHTRKQLPSRDFERIEQRIEPRLGTFADLNLQVPPEVIMKSAQQIRPEIN
jgi:hypothetical protein